MTVSTGPLLLAFLGAMAPFEGAVNSRCVSLGDLDQDGDLDVFVANDTWQEGDGRNQVWLNPSIVQDPPKLILDKVFPEPFGRVGPVREISDGRVMVPDPLGQVLAVVDFNSETADTLGRSGAGPQEYQQPDAVFPLRGDTTLLVDLGNARMAVMQPDGTFLETIPMGQQVAGGGIIVALPRGVDRKGRLYFRSEVQPMGSHPDSAALLRFDPSTQALDTLAMLKVPELPPPPLPGGGGSRGKAAEPQDDWAVGADGGVFVVRIRDYAAEWISDGGQLIQGPPNRYEGIRIREGEKLRWLEEFAGGQVSMTADESGTVAVSRRDGKAGVSAVDMYEWPSEFPAVKPGRTHVTPHGEAWVERFAPADEPPLIDRFDRTGKRIGGLRLPQGRRIVGFGKEAVFLVFTDQFGLEWIERHLIQPDPAESLEACTAFALHTDRSSWMGKNLDWEVEDGIVVVNQRGVVKRAWPPGTESELSWVSRYGSVTFNQYSWGFPLGGMNEAGLVVEELSYSPTRYPPPDSRKAITELQWIQYQLDNFASVGEVLASDTLIRIEKSLFGLHYLVADRKGSAAVIEFLDGKQVVYTGSDLPVPALSNDTYRNLTRYLAFHEGFGGSRIVSDGPGAPERFVRAATLLRAYETWGNQLTGNPTLAEESLQEERPDPENFTFKILDSVRQSDTQWSIAYDLGEGRISFQTRSYPSRRTLTLDTLDFSCRPEDLILPLSTGARALIQAGEGPWTTSENRRLVELVFSKLGTVFSPEDLPDPGVLESLGGYPSSARCAGGGRDRSH